MRDSQVRADLKYLEYRFETLRNDFYALWAKHDQLVKALGLKYDNEARYVKEK